MLVIFALNTIGTSRVARESYLDRVLKLNPMLVGRSILNPDPVLFCVCPSTDFEKAVEPLVTEETAAKNTRACRDARNEEAHHHHHTPHLSMYAVPLITLPLSATWQHKQRGFLLIVVSNWNLKVVIDRWMI